MELTILIATKIKLLLIALGLVLIPMAIFEITKMIINKLFQWIFESSRRLLKELETQPGPEGGTESQAVAGAGRLAGGVRK